MEILIYDLKNQCNNAMILILCCKYNISEEDIDHSDESI